MSWSTALTTANLNMQDFFSTTLSVKVTDGTDTVINLTTVPNASEGFLVIDPLNTQGAGFREVIFYNSKGASTVTVPSAANGRGVQGTAQGHNVGVEVRMAGVAEYWQSLKDGFAFSAGAITQAKIAPSAIDLATIANPTPWTSYVPAWTGFSVNPTVDSAKYMQIGKTVTCDLFYSSDGTSNATTFTVTLPVAAKNGCIVKITRVRDSGTYSGIAVGTVSAGSNVMTLFKDATGTAWTATGQKSCDFSFTYEAQ